MTETYEDNKDLGIVFGENYSTVTEKFNTDVLESVIDIDTIRLVFGNSGFEFRYRYERNGDVHSRFDFEPEGKNSQFDKRTGKYAMMLSSSLLELRNWFRDINNLSKYRIEQPLLPIKIESTTFDLINGLYTMFERHGNHEEMISAYASDYYLEIDLDSFVNLPDKDELIEFLKKVRNRANDIEVTYQKMNKINV